MHDFLLQKQVQRSIVSSVKVCLILGARSEPLIRRLAQFGALN